MPVIGLGSWNMEQDDKASVIRAVHRAIDLGMNHLDTAELYGSGEVEQLLGEALRGRRDQVYLVSKVMPSHASYNGTLDCCEDSLKRLGTDHLDLYLLHWPERRPLEPTFRAFHQLQAQGKIRAFGVSNFDVAELEKAQALAGSAGLACNQVIYHLEERDIEHEVLPWCQARGVALVGYSPFGSRRQAWTWPGGQEALERIAARHGVTAHAVALAFLVREPGTFTIPKSSSPERVAANARAGDLALDAADLAAIEAAFPRGKKKRGLPTI